MVMITTVMPIAAFLLTIQSLRLRFQSVLCILVCPEPKSALTPKSHQDLQNDPRFFQSNILNKRRGSRLGFYTPLMSSFSSVLTKQRSGGVKIGFPGMHAW